MLNIITPFSRMEGRQTVRSVLIFCFMIGMLVGQSTAKTNWTYSECYNLCTKVCFYSTHGNFRGDIGCMRCAKYCRRQIYGEVCIFKWCWKVKNWGWFFFWCWWELGILVETMQGARTSHYLRRAMILIKVEKSIRKASWKQLFNYQFN